MRDLYKEVSKFYRQTETKKMILIPGVKRSLKKCLSTKNQKVIDIGCGTGDFYQIVKSLKLKYIGIDSSPSMLQRAKLKYPNVDFRFLSGTSLSSHFKEKFDIALLNLVMQDNKIATVKRIFQETNKCLKANGFAVVSIHHPNYDHYMRYGLLGKTGVKTSFRGYFKNDQKYFIDYEYEKSKPVRFIDYHWTLENYINIFLNRGFTIKYIDECKPIKIGGTTQRKLTEKSGYPTYMVVTLQKVVK